MKRRTFLGMAAVGAVAGCMTDEEQQKVKLLNHQEFITEYGSIGVSGEVKNLTDEVLDYVQVDVQVYDRDDTRVGSAMANVTNLGPGRIWQFEAICIDCTRSNANTYSIQVHA